MLSPKNKIEFLSAPSDYLMADEWYQFVTEGHFWFTWRFEALKRIIPKNYTWGRALDIGCGNGIMLDQVRKHYGCMASGCDLNLKALEMISGSENPLYFYNIHERNKKFEGAFSTILLIDVLEHIKDPIGFLGSVGFHHKKGGSLIINVPAIQLFFSKYDRAAGHIRRYSISSLSKELDSAGFYIERASYWGMSMVPLLFIRKLMFLFYKKNHIIKIGFQPASPLINSALDWLRRAECAILRRPPIGTSLVVLAKKKD